MNLELELQDTEDLDEEWVDLILEAREAGLTVEEIRAYFRSRKGNK